MLDDDIEGQGRKLKVAMIIGLDSCLSILLASDPNSIMCSSVMTF